MWKLLPLLVVVVNLILSVTAGKDSITVITTNVAAAGAASAAGAEGGNGTEGAAAAAAAAAAASSTTVIKTHTHTKKCAINEKYMKCPEKLCQPQLCEEVGFPQCDEHKGQMIEPGAGGEETCDGPAACVCKDKYVRNDEGVCMPVKDCPSCGNDKNATFGCGVNCGKRCSNYNKGPVFCADVCYDNSCDCKDGFVFDDYRGFCVLPDDCSNKNAPDPEGTEGTPGNGEDEDTDTDPCEDCEEENCDPKKTCATKKPNDGDKNSEATTEGSGMESTTHRHKKHKKHSKTTPASTGNPDSSTEGSEMTTMESESETTPDESESEATTEGSGMESTTHRHKKHKKHSKTTPASTGKPDSSTEGSEMTTMESESEATTEDSGMESTTHQHKKHKKTTPASTEVSSCPDSSTEGSEMTTEGCGMESTTHRHKKHKKHMKTTPASTENSDSSSEESEMTTECSGMKITTEGSNEETTPEDSEENKTTDDSNESTESESSSSTEAATTSKKTKKPRTTTKSSGESMSTTRRPKRTKRPTTTRKPKRTKMPKTTTESGEETTTGETTMMPEGPKDCKGKHEYYTSCAPLCPQKSCDDYLNGAKCPSTSGKKCKPECRCHIGYYKDDEGNCLSSWECKRRARSTTMSSSSSSSTTEDPDNEVSTTTMMSTTPKDPNCEDVANELFRKGNLVYTIKLMTDLCQRDPGNNVMVGGASILYLISQLTLFMRAKSSLRTESLHVLNFKNTKQIRCFMPKISANLTASYPDIAYQLFCKIYADEDYALTDEFIESTTKTFGMGPENINFGSEEGAIKINADVAQYTKNKILNFVKPTTMKELTGLVLVDAEKFEGIWEKQFHPSATMMREFYSQGRIDKIATMRQRGWFLCAESNKLNAKLLKLKYRGGKFSLVIILPNAIDGLKDLLKRMENPDNILSAVDSMKHEDVEVYLPKVKLSVANRLKLSSEEANMKEIFNNETTGLKDIGAAKDPYVNEILQRMQYEINEFGMGNKLNIEFPAPEEIPRSPKFGQTHIFKADHPFAFLLCYDDAFQVLAAGIFIQQ